MASPHKQEDNPLALTNGQNPPNPPLRKGGIKCDYLTCNKSSSPLAKGDRGGFCCAFVFPKITAAYLLYEKSLTIQPAQQVGFESSNESRPFEDPSVRGRTPGILDFCSANQPEQRDTLAFQANSMVSLFRINPFSTFYA